MKILIAGLFLSTLGILPVAAFDTYVQPQLESLERMYSSMDQTAEDIASGKEVKNTKTYQSAEDLSGGWSFSTSR